MKLLNLLFIIGLSLIGIVFAVANRQWVPLSMDPFSQSDPALAISLPLFLIIFGAVFLGMLIGASVTWMGQGRVRRDLRATKREEKALRKQVDATKPAEEKSGLPVLPAQPAAPAVPVPQLKSDEASKTL